VTPKILAACSPGEVRVAVASGSRLLDYAIWRPGAPDGVGDLHRGRILSRIPSMAGAFVAIAGAEGFLPDSETTEPPTEGTILPVRVTRAAQGGKGPRLSARLTEPEKTLFSTSGPCPALLQRGPGGVEILAARFPDAPIELDDPATAAALQPALGTRVSIVRAAFNEAVASAVDALAETSVSLPGGAVAHVEPTRALIAIDIDASTQTTTRRDKNTAQLAGNRAIIPELARQIRLRNLSGAIVIDFAGLSIRRRQALGPELTAALRPDPLHPRFLGFSALGLAEILRPRIHPPLHELLAGPHAAGLAALRLMATEMAAEPSRTITLRAAPAVLAALQADTVALADLAHRTGRKPTLRADPSLGATGWTLEG
jgi:Ribonuclease G/E